jgi:hypothetical protein
MIHHISIPAEDPLHVAEVMAGIWNGRVLPFPPRPGSYMAFAGDECGTAVEVYLLGTELVPGEGEEGAEFQTNASPSRFTATHAAISVGLSQEQIEQIGAREGWRVVRCSRGYFDVIEFWVENRLLLELLPPELAAQYAAAWADPWML